MLLHTPPARLWPHRFLLPVVVLCTFAACRPSREAANDFIFFEHRLDSLNSIIKNLEEPRIKKNDIISINVSSASLNQEQTEVFNLMNNAAGRGGMGGGIMGGGLGLFGYLVDYDGTITLPIIGRIMAEGLTKNELSASLVEKLGPWVKNPVVNIRFINFRVLMMGEVRTPGWQTFPNERATIVDAIGQAGGLTDLGMRENILLIRELPGGKREYHSLNINDARIFASPYFQLQQNDIVYVLPNNTRLIQYQRQNSPFFRDLPVYMGLVTSILAFGTLILALLR
jgi:polysaccharide export outer membrane protein